MQPGMLVKFIDSAPDNHFLDSLITILHDNYGKPPYACKIGLILDKEGTMCKVLFYKIPMGKKRIWQIGEKALVRII
jgi:hypothetical protein